MRRCCLLIFALLVHFSILSTAHLNIRKRRDVVAAVCKRRPELPYCRASRGPSEPVTPLGIGISEPFPMGVPEMGKPAEKVKNPFEDINERNSTKKPTTPKIVLDPKNEQELSNIKVVDHHPWTSGNNWGFENEARDQKRPSKIAADSPTYVPKTSKKLQQIYDSLYWVPREVAVPANVVIPTEDPNHSGLLKDIGSIDVGFNFGVPSYPGNDPVSVGAKVGVGFGASGKAGKLPPYLGFPPQGEEVSLNDYDGNKRLIVPDKAQKVAQLLRLGILKPVSYAAAKQLVGVNTGIGIGHPGGK
uniref:Conserved secreted protein n=1 Tax=Steinernema glaseri TaxID=37863 RepID=A0A1I7YWJ7_9BILA